MKTKLITLFLALAASVGTMFSSNTQVDGIWYDLNDNSNTASVTYRGSSFSSYSNEYSGSIVIPSSVSYNDKTYNVTSIGKTAFYGCSSLTSVAIPNSVTSIGEYAFEYCSGLTSITIPNSVTSIGGFSFCYTSLTSITIPNSVTSIGNGIFYGCTGLTSITIPISITSIGADAFNGCTGLTSITIPNRVTSIKNSTFAGCSNLTSITIPNSITSIGDKAFCGCTSLASVAIPNSSHTEYGHDVFRGCVSLPIIDNIRYADTYLVEAVDKTLSTYTIQPNTTWIGDSAFSKCQNLNTIEIPDNVKGIGRAPFYGCYKLPVVNNVRYAGSYAVQGLNNKTTYTIKEGTKWIGAFAFYNEQNNHSNLVSVEIPNGVKDIGEYAFWYCNSLTSVTIPNSVTRIRQRAFCNCTGLTSIEIPDSITRIEDGTFSGCSTLMSIEIPNSVTSIGKGAFDCCHGLTYVEIPNSVKTIENEAFYQCHFLDSVVIGENVKSIGSDAFSICWSLRSFVVKLTTPPSLGSNVFSDSGSKYSIYVPCGTVDTYKNANKWKTYANKIKNMPSPFRINTISENGTISVPKYSICDDSVKIVANPIEGYHFVQWLDGETKNPRTIYLTQDTTFMAQFAINQYVISVTCNPQLGSIEGDCGTFNHGTELTYNAIANEGYHFVQWSDEVVDNPRTIFLTQDSILLAEFAINTYLVKFFGFNSVLLDSQSVDHRADAVAPEAPIVEHYDFIGWDKEFTNVTSNLDVFAIYQKNTEDVENVNIDSLPYKIMMEGQIFIRRGEKVYTLQGQEVR